MELDFILQFLDSIFLQEDGGGFFGLGDRKALGSDDPIIKGLILTMFCVSAFGIVLNLFNAGIRKKMVDQVKLKRIMKETRAYQKERMAAMRAKDDEKTAKLNQKSSYMNKMQMEMMTMNMRPMLFTLAPLFIIFIFVLPALFFFTVAISPVSLNVIPIDYYIFDITCSEGELIGVEYEKDVDGNDIEDKDGNKIVKGEYFCNYDNEIRLIGWYILSSISFSGIIMKLTKTSMGMG